MKSCSDLLTRKSYPALRGPVIALHEHYHPAGVPFAEAGPAAVIQRQPQSIEAVIREALLCASLDPCWACWNGRSALDGYPLPTLIYPEDVLPASAFDRCFNFTLRVAIADPDWRRYARDAMRAVSCDSPSRIGHSINVAMRDRATVIFVANVTSYFPSEALEVIAGRLLTVTYGPGAIYVAPRKAVCHE